MWGHSVLSVWASHRLCACLARMGRYWLRMCVYSGENMVKDSSQVMRSLIFSVDKQEFAVMPWRTFRINGSRTGSQAPREARLTENLQSWAIHSFSPSPSQAESQQHLIHFARLGYWLSRSRLSTDLGSVLSWSVIAPNPTTTSFDSPTILFSSPG